MLSSAHLSHHTFDNTSNLTDQGREGSAQFTSGHGDTTRFTPPQTSPLLALPTEILVYLLQYLRDATTPLLLSTTCYQLRSMYQDERLYTAQDRQLHRFTYTLNTPALYEALHAKLPNTKLSDINVPDPHTPEWKALKDQPLPAGLVRKKLQKVFVQKTYLLAWELLLQAIDGEDKAYILKLMQLVGKLSPHINNTQSYAKQLFNNAFPQALFKKLTAISLDWSLPLVYGHFALREARPFVAELDPALSIIINNAQYVMSQWQFASSYLAHKPYPSFQAAL